MPDELEFLKDLGRGDGEPGAASVERARDLLGQRVARSEREPPRSTGRRLRVGLAAAAVTLALGGVLGLALAGVFAPSGGATGLVGFGFLPAQGWHVSQTGEPDATGVARAVAANVPLDPRAVARRVSRATLQDLPAHGIVISANFSPRGDPEVDATYPVRQPPLLVDDAEPVAPGRFELRAGIRAYNVLLQFAYGAESPPSWLQARAQRQLERLIVAAERITIFVRPAVVPNAPAATSVTIFGSVDGARAGETVEIQAKDCGSSFFRLVSGATTESGGSWSTVYWPQINTTIRAVWNDLASPQIAVRMRVRVSLRKNRDGRSLQVTVFGRRSFWRKRVEIQRRDPRLGTWRRAQVVTVTETFGNRGSGPGGSSVTFADFRPSVPRGTVLRAVMPLSEAKPCYLAGTSIPLRW